MGVKGIGGSVKVVDAFDELAQEGGARGVRGTICAEQAVGSATTRELLGHLGAVRQMPCLCTLGGVRLARANSPRWKFGAAGDLGLLRRPAAAAELRATQGVGALKAVRSSHIGALGPAWSSGRKGHKVGMVQVTVSVGTVHLASRHCPGCTDKVSRH